MKSRIPKITLGLLLAAVLVPSSAFGQLGATVPNWTVPSHHGAMTTMTDVTNPLPFIGVTPCRVVDTRNAPGVFGGPALVAGATRNFPLPVGPCAGLPAAPRAYSLNITVVNTTGPGFIKIWPQGGAEPLVSTLNYLAGQTVANAAIVPAGASAGVSVKAGVSGTDLIIDINGYYGDTLGTPQDVFVLFNNSTAETMNLNNASTICSAFCGLKATVGSGYAVYGASDGAGTSGRVGVYGQSNDGIGTYGNSANYNGVWANSDNFDALAAFGGRDGGYLQGARNGVIGASTSTAAGTAGVAGFHGALSTFNYGTPVAILGRSSAGTTGIVGTADGTNGWGIEGFRLNTNGSTATAGVLGYVGTSGVHSFEDVTAGGSKPFVVPYAGKAEKQIVFVSTEADEVLTAKRGRVSLQRGIAVIHLPDHFLNVTEPDTWSIQLTPIGEMASLAVVSMNGKTGEIVIQGSRSVDVFYRVEGVRKGYKDFNPVQENVYFRPHDANAKMDPWPERTRQVLIENKIYNADGTPNLETARTLGWTQMWEESKARNGESGKPARQDGN